MQKIFNTLINSFIENRIGIANQFLSETLAQHLKTNLTGLYDKLALKKAGTGITKDVDHSNKFRTDKIHWLSRDHNEIYENEFFDCMDTFVKYLNDSCYTGINSYEFHYTLYEPGTCYKKHLDQFRNNNSRKYSMIIYLNNDWKKEDGGELCIYQNNDYQNISPSNGKTVFFQSNELEHEVLVTNKPRMSITGWLKV